MSNFLHVGVGEDFMNPSGYFFLLSTLLSRRIFRVLRYEMDAIPSGHWTF
jgi:hypothetical protein